MNIYIFITALVLTGTVCLSQNPSIRVQTNFNGFHCDGKPGLCSITNRSNQADGNTVLILHNKKTLSLIVERVKLSQREFENVVPTTVKGYIDSSKTYYLHIPVPFQLENSIRASLESGNPTLIIPKGSYPMEISEDTITITFNLH